MFDFFISHSSRYKEIAKLIFYTSKSNDVNPWYDESHLDFGSDIQPSLLEGVEQSKGYLLLHSKYIYNSKFICSEMAKAKKEKEKRGNDFKIIVVKIDDEKIRDKFWGKYKYLDWDYNNESYSILQLIESFTGKRSLLGLTMSSLLNLYPSTIFSSREGTIAEHTRNFLLTQIAHIKFFLSSVSCVTQEKELRDSISKLLNTNIFEQMPNISPRIYAIGNGMWECLHANRMRIAPQIKVSGLPSEYKLKTIHNDEVYTRFCFEKDGKLVVHALPFMYSMIFDAEL